MERAEQIERWLAMEWKKARDSNAIDINTRGYNVAVWEQDERPGSWTYRIRKQYTDREGEEFGNDFRCELDAKIKALSRLADILNL